MAQSSIDIAESLARLSASTIFELRGEWRRLHRAPPPMRLSRDLLLRAENRNRNSACEWCARPAMPVGLYARAQRTKPARAVSASRCRSLAQVNRHPSPGAVGPASRRWRRYADAPAASLLTDLGAGEWSFAGVPARTPFFLRCFSDSLRLSLFLKMGSATPRPSRPSPSGGNRRTG
jgi:hypothetical protein